MRTRKFGRASAAIAAGLVLAFAGCSNPVIDEIVGEMFTIEFYSASGTVIPAQTVQEGGLATPPETPARAWFPAAGLWPMPVPTGYVFGGWRHGGAVWNFAASPVTGNKTLTAYWSPPSAARVEGVEINDVGAAVAHVNEYPGAFLLVIDEDVESARNQITGDGAHLTIIGLGGRREIRFTDEANNQRLFDVGASGLVADEGTASLTLGNNITLVGRDDNTLSLIRVRDNARLYMEPGSKITGHTHSGTAGNSGSGSAVHVAGYGSFTMRGGTITGNRATGGNVDNTAAAGGMSVYTVTARFHMTGGSITGNYRGEDMAADVNIGNAVDYFTMSGDATIGRLNLNANANNNSFITVGAGWTGGVCRLDLRLGTSTTSNAVDRWLDETVMRAADGHAITADDVGRITSAHFLGNAVTVTQPVAKFHGIVVEDDGAVGVLRVVVPEFAVTFNSAGGTTVAPQTIMQGAQVIEPAPPTRASSDELVGTITEAGLWTMTYRFLEWRDEYGVAWDFETPVTQDIELTAEWDRSSTELARVAAVAANNLTAAVAHVNAHPGRYTLAISQPVNPGPNSLNTNGAHLTIVGIGAQEVRFITESGVNDQRLFLIGGTSAASANLRDASLTLGNNITLVGRRTGQHGQANNTVDLVRVQHGGRLYMQDNSRITGHTNTATGMPGGFGAAVFVEAGGTFRVRDDAEITGNVATNTGSSIAGGVSQVGGTSRFYMEGGSVTGNTRGTATNPPVADVFLATNVNYFTLSGDAEIGRLILEAASGANIANSAVAVSDWTGSVGYLDLRFATAGVTIADVAERWTGRTILRAETGTAATDALGSLVNSHTRFIGSPATMTQPVANFHEIVVEGSNAEVRALPTSTITFVTGEGASTIATVLTGSPMTPPVDPAGPAWTGTPTSPGLWLMRQVVGEWRQNGTRWDFDNNVLGDMTLTAHWVDPTEPVAAVEINNVTQAVAHVNANPGTFTLAINQNVYSGPNNLTVLNVNLTVIGLGGVAREIRFVNAVNTGRLFSVGPTSNNANAARLTLGNNITLVGRTESQHEQANNANDLVRVWNGGRLYMEEGSKITGHTSNNNIPTSGNGAAVNVGANGTFTMRGGTITGNIAIQPSTSVAGGVSITAATGRFHMEGGIVSGNTRGVSVGTPAPSYADVSIVDTVPVYNFTVSGAATIGRLVLFGSATAHAPLTVNTGWTGSVRYLDLRFINNVAIAQIVTDLTGNTVVRAAANHTLTVADLERIGCDLTRFIGTSTGTAAVQNFGGNHTIALENGAGVVRAAYTVTFYSSCGTPIAPQVFLASAGETVTEPVGLPATRPWTPGAGLWRVATLPATGTYTLAGWWNGNEQWDFADTVTESMTLTARWHNPAVPRVETVAANNVPQAVNYVNANPGTFTLAISQDLTLTTTQVITVPGVNLTIVGIGIVEGQPWEIALTGSFGGTRLFDIGHTTYGQTSNATLILGNDITLRGRSSNVELVRVWNGGRFDMNDRTSITGHNNTDGASSGASGAAVHVGPNGTFNMRGGTITGNRAGFVQNAWFWLIGGVSLSAPTSVFNMTGGSVTGNFRTNNTNVPADVRAVSGVNNFSMSGSATIGNLKLYAAWGENSFITVGVGAAAWTGHVAELDLMTTSDSLSTIIGNWTNPGRRVLQAQSGSLPTNIVSRIHFAQFLRGDQAAAIPSASQAQPLSPGHSLIHSGAGVYVRSN